MNEFMCFRFRELLNGFASSQDLQITCNPTTTTTTSFSQRNWYSTYIANLVHRIKHILQLEEQLNSLLASFTQFSLPFYSFKGPVRPKFPETKKTVTITITTTQNAKGDQSDFDFVVSKSFLLESEENLRRNEKKLKKFREEEIRCKERGCACHSALIRSPTFFGLRHCSPALFQRIKCKFPSQ